MKTIKLTFLIAGLRILSFQSHAELATEPDWRIHNGTVENVWTDQNWGRFVGTVIKGSEHGGIWCVGSFVSPQTASFVPDNGMSDTSQIKRLNPEEQYAAFVKNLPQTLTIGQHIDVMVRYRGEAFKEANVNVLGGIEALVGGTEGRHRSTILGNEPPDFLTSLILDFCKPTDAPHLINTDLQRYNADKSNRLREFEAADKRKAIAAQEAIVRQQNEDDQKKAATEEKQHQAFNAQLDSANRGIASSQYEIGIRYLKGDSVTADEIKGREWLEKASAQGNFDAKVALEALAYNIDIGDRVIMLDLRYAMNGIASSQYKLGMRFLNGDGIPQDNKFAKQWLDKAASNGNSDAKKALSTLGQ